MMAVRYSTRFDAVNGSIHDGTLPHILLSQIVINDAPEAIIRDKADGMIEPSSAQPFELQVSFAPAPMANPLINSQVYSCTFNLHVNMLPVPVYF